MDTEDSTQGTTPSGRDLELPTNRAFVVQLSADADLKSGRIAGRVEHVVSGQAAHFYSLEELLAFMERDFKAPDADA